MKKTSRSHDGVNTWQPKEMKDLPYHLRGPANNRFGGQQRARLRGLRGTTYGPASEGRSLSESELQEVIVRLRKEGRIS